MVKSNSQATPKPESLTLQRKPSPSTPTPGASLPTPTLATNRSLSPIVRSVYESLALRDPNGAERYLEAHHQTHER